MFHFVIFPVIFPAIFTAGVGLRPPESLPGGRPGLHAPDHLAGVGKADQLPVDEQRGELAVPAGAVPRELAAVGAVDDRLPGEKPPRTLLSAPHL